MDSQLIDNFPFQSVNSKLLSEEQSLQLDIDSSSSITTAENLKNFREQIFKVQKIPAGIVNAFQITLLKVCFRRTLPTIYA